MPDRSLLLLPPPGAPIARGKKPRGGGASVHTPGRGRQAARLQPRFEALQAAFEARRIRLAAESGALAPEDVVVLETVSTVSAFFGAVRRIGGLEWMGELDREDIPPDDDFFRRDDEGQRTEKPIRGRAFLVLSNQTALKQIYSLWAAYKRGEDPPHRLKAWRNMFDALRDVRPWGIQDRLLETGVLDDWADRVAHEEEELPCEIELWYRNNPGLRHSAAERVARLVTARGGAVRGQCVIDEIGYHAILASLPSSAISTLLEDAGPTADLVQCEQIQFFRATGQMTCGPQPQSTATMEPPAPGDPLPLGSPVVALLDGLPLQNHHLLARRLVVDDPDRFEDAYPARHRSHGTAMASLILHGDLDAGHPPLARRLYVRPIMQPDPKDFRGAREVVPETTLVVDLVHRAVRRLLDPEATDALEGSEVCVINLSVGLRDRMFFGAMSPLARLLDWLAWKYRVLFVVSAGNHAGLTLPISREDIVKLSPDAMQQSVLETLAADVRNRRLLSPAEAVNAITVGAAHEDAAQRDGPPRSVMPYPASSSGMPSPVNAQGMGYRRAIKPDVLAPGGRVALNEARIVQPSPSETRVDIYAQSGPPGQRVAMPGPSDGDRDRTGYTRGTSNATALVSRAASGIYDVLQGLRAESGGEVLDRAPAALWIKTLLAHTAAWGPAGDVLAGALRTDANSRRFSEYVTRLLGYGVVRPELARECDRLRATALGAGSLRAETAHVHRFPLPPSLSGRVGLRRLTVTLGWFTPVNPANQIWRQADLWFQPAHDALGVGRREADWQAVQRGTLQHEIFEGDRVTGFVDGAAVDIQVNCRASAGALGHAVPYALAVSLEVAPELNVDVYSEVKARILAARVGVAPGA